MAGLFLIAAGLIGFAVFIVLIVWSRGTDAAQSFERIEFLRSLAEESWEPPNQRSRDSLSRC